MVDVRDWLKIPGVVEVCFGLLDFGVYLDNQFIEVIFALDQRNEVEAHHVGESDEVVPYLAKKKPKLGLARLRGPCERNEGRVLPNFHSAVRILDHREKELEDVGKETRFGVDKRPYPAVESNQPVEHGYAGHNQRQRQIQLGAAIERTQLAVDMAYVVLYGQKHVIFFVTQAGVELLRREFKAKLLGRVVGGTDFKSLAENIERLLHDQRQKTEKCPPDLEESETGFLGLVLDVEIEENYVVLVADQQSNFLPEKRNKVVRLRLVVPAVKVEV